jgi:hypothetical protein
MLVAGLVTALTATVALPSARASSTTTVVSRSNLPSGFTDFAGGGPCAPGPGHGEYLHVAGPASPPIGAGSLELTATPNYQTNLYDDTIAGTPATDLTRFVVHSDHATADSAELHALVVTSTAIFGAVIPATGGWASFDALTAAGESGTWSQFLTDNPVATISYLGVALEGCESSDTATANVDDLEIGISGQTTRFDFEPASAPTATILGHVDHTAIVTGKSVTPRVTVSYGGSGVAGVPVNLLARRASSTGYRKIATATTNSAGAAVATVQHPPVTTSYEWQVPSGGDIAPAISTASKVAVASKLSINLDRSRVKKGKKFTATGVMKPGHTGDRITLFASKKGHVRSLATSKVRGDGSYAVSGKLKKPGGYQVFTTAAADKTNSKGTSPKKKLKVH